MASWLGDIGCCTLADTDRVELSWEPERREGDRIIGGRQALERFYRWCEGEDIV